ncbi:MAG: DEAD/DEAH box helicase [Mobilitalea sp.]
MLIGKDSKYLLKKTRAKAKMIEYNVPEELHIKVEKEVGNLFLLTVASIGNMSVTIINDRNNYEQNIEESKAELEFASKYFDAYLNTEFDAEADDYYLLLGAVAYFLCDYIGSSKVLINKMDIHSLDLGANGIDKCLAALLMDTFDKFIIHMTNDTYKQMINDIQSQYKIFYQSGKYPNYDIVLELRNEVYKNGSDLELLLVDAFAAIFYLKISNSAINLLPKYSGNAIEAWGKAVFENGLIRDLWPAQRKLGKMGIFKGNSAVIQMPTSAGKTKSISIIIASSFIAEKTKLAVIVAPFRALCREISNDLDKDFKYDASIHIDELSDIMQNEELGIDRYGENEKTVIVATPEKLIYLLRQRQELVDEIGVIIFDEGHLFDEPERGIVYELLISMIKGFLSDRVQKILVSAIIPNAVQLNSWINGDNGVVIADNTIKSTQKTVAFTDWKVSDGKPYANLYFVDPENPEDEEFYVPRLVPIEEIKKNPREKKIRTFPEVDFKKEKVLNNDIAIYYGLNLCRNGGVGIFSGKKDTANNMLGRILDLDDRGYDTSSFLKSADENEVKRMCNLIEANYGAENNYYQAGKLGAFVHHAGISNGIKISLEHAMRKGDIHFLICTSTLAQGVNLPIRYLVITSMYQGRDRIRVRDFHNLIGRAGRSGLYTEGNILLTETFIYNRRGNHYSRAGFKWDEYKHFLDSNNAEACSSRILFLVKHCEIYFGKNLYTIDIKSLIGSYYSAAELFPNEYAEYIKRITQDYPEISDTIQETLRVTVSSLGAIESFLMTYLLEDTWEECEENVHNILADTLAYHLATEDDKNNLIQMFDAIGKYCIENVKSASERYICSRSLLSVKKMLHIKKQISFQIENILDCRNTSDLLSCVFSTMKEVYSSNQIQKLENSDCILNIALLWIGGKTYFEICKYAQEKSFRIWKRKKYHVLGLDDIVKICDSIVSYDSTVILSAISEVVNDSIEDNKPSNKLFRELSSEMKYGLPYGTATIIYEMGFSDRVVAEKIAEYYQDRDEEIYSKQYAKKMLIEKYDDIEKILDDYPAIFFDKLNSLML